VVLLPLFRKEGRISCKIIIIIVAISYNALLIKSFEKNYPCHSIPSSMSFFLCIKILHHRYTNQN
jgi:hypothetical protein